MERRIFGRSLVLLFVLAVFSRGGELHVCQSNEIRTEDFFRELHRLDHESQHKQNLLLLQKDRLNAHLESVRKLEKGGFRSPLERQRIELEVSKNKAFLAARKEYDELLDAVIDDLDGKPLAVPPKSKFDTSFRLRLPGLTLRQGGADYFTVKMKANSKVSEALTQYTLANMSIALDYPNKAPMQKYAQSRLDGYAKVNSARKSELDKWHYETETWKQAQYLINNQYRKRWQQLRQIWQFNRHLQGKRLHEEEVTFYSGSNDSFWLFGDGSSRATPISQISPATIEIARQTASSRHAEVRVANAQRQIQRRKIRLQDLAKKGYANAAELRDSKLVGDLSILDAEILKADEAVKRKELEQLQVATNGVKTDVETVVLPNKETAQSWFVWMTEINDLDAADVLHCLPIVEEMFLAGAAMEMAQRHRAFTEKVRLEYSNITSLQLIELDQLDSAVSIAEANLMQAVETKRLITSRLKQWALRYSATANTNHRVDPDVMSAVMAVGKEVNLARVKLAELQEKRAQRLLAFDRDYRDRLARVHRKGAATSIELQKTANQVRRSEGLVLSSKRTVEIAKQKAVILEVLYQYGGLRYTGEGLEMAYFSPELMEALRQHSMIADTANPGVLQRHSADLDDVNIRIASLNKLLKKGHASPVELQWATRDKEIIKNRISLESARNKLRDRALAVIGSLGIEDKRRFEFPENKDSRL